MIPSRLVCGDREKELSFLIIEKGGDYFE